MAEPEIRIAPAPLERFVDKVFVRLGCTQPEARAIAAHLVDANLTGHDSHGVQHVKGYVQHVHAGRVMAGRALEPVIERGSYALYDCGRGFGQWLGLEAVERGVALARAHGIGMLALRNCGHLGRLGAWPERAASSGIASLHFLNANGPAVSMVPFGGTDRRMGSNPIAFGMPAGEGERPVILDMATTQYAIGKVSVARNKGAKLPTQSIRRPTGELSDDPAHFFGPPLGAMLAVGGHKGYGLAVFNELLAGALTGSGTADPEKEPFGSGPVLSNMFSIYIDPAVFGPPAELAKSVAALRRSITASPPADPEKPVMLPGDPEANQRAARRQRGIPLDRVTWESVLEGAKLAGMPQAEIDASAPRPL
jgi:hydroxycarboxylate dehydrogenase B